MKLTELFPKGAVITIDGKDYELEYSTRSVLQLENDYPEQTVKEDKTDNSRYISTDEQVRKMMGKLLAGRLPKVDFIRLLFALLANTKAFKKQEDLIDLVKPLDFPVYGDAMVYAFTKGINTPEQFEKLEVMAEASESKKNGPSVTTE